MPRALVVTPLEKELAALRAAVVEAGHEAKAVEARVPAFEAAGLMWAAAGHGKAQFALVTQHLVDTAGPFEALVVAGAAGALSPRLRPGDVVVGTESVEHDYRPRFHGEAPPPRHPASAELRRRVVETPGPWPFGVHEGPIAGGDEDIVEAPRARALHRSTGALCVAWEGPGGARAAAFNGLPFLELRAVTDAADGAAAASYRTHLDRAVGHVARVLLAGLS